MERSKLMTDRSFCIEYHPSAPHSERYSAVDDATYDGAPDSKGVARLVGWGATPEEAVTDWQIQYWDLVEENGWDEDDEDAAA